MANTPQRAEWWIDFICTKCRFPAPEKLRAQFSAAELSEFCDCGCNSFKVRLRPGADVPPIAQPGGYGKVFEADFRFAADEKTLEVILLADENGNLAYVEIDCCANCFPIPDVVAVAEPPFHVHASQTLAL